MDLDFTDDELQRYSRHILLAEVGGIGSSGQQRFVLDHLSRLVVVDDWPP